MISRRPASGGSGARAVGLDFFLPEPVGAGAPPQSICGSTHRSFSRNCGQFTGEFELRFYNAAEGPLAAPSAVPAGTDTVTGRRVRVP